MAKIVAVVILFLSTLSPDYVTPSIPTPCRVKVVISADGGIGKTLTGYMHRELRKLKDVEIDTEKPEWTISIILIKTNNKRGSHTGYAMSVVITRHVDMTYYLPANTPDFVRELASDLSFVVHHKVGVIPTIQSVYDELTSISLEFDVSSLEPLRQMNKLK